MLSFPLLMQVFTCGDNSSFCCGHRDTTRPIFRPRLVEALKGASCKQVLAYYDSYFLRIILDFSYLGSGFNGFDMF